MKSLLILSAFALALINFSCTKDEVKTTPTTTWELSEDCCDEVVSVGAISNANGSQGCDYVTINVCTDQQFNRHWNAGDGQFQPVVGDCN